MAYIINIEINGYNFQFGNLDYSGGIGAFIKFDDLKIKDAINKDELSFYSAIKELLNCSDELDALYTMSNFENYTLQGNDWRALLSYYSFNLLEEYKRKALIVLYSNKSIDYQIEISSKILDILNGDFYFPPPAYKSSV